MLLVLLKSSLLMQWPQKSVSILETLSSRMEIWHSKMEFWSWVGDALSDPATSTHQVALWMRSFFLCFTLVKRPLNRTLTWCMCPLYLVFRLASHPFLFLFGSIDYCSFPDASVHFVLLQSNLQHALCACPDILGICDETQTKGFPSPQNFSVTSSCSCRSLCYCCICPKQIWEARVLWNGGFEH